MRPKKKKNRHHELTESEKYPQLHRSGGSSCVCKAESMSKDESHAFGPLTDEGKEDSLGQLGNRETGEKRKIRLGNIFKILRSRADERPGC